MFIGILHGINSGTITNWYKKVLLWDHLNDIIFSVFFFCFFIIKSFFFYMIFLINRIIFPIK